VRHKAYISFFAIMSALSFCFTAAGEIPIIGWAPSYEEAFVSQIDEPTIGLLSETLTLSDEQAFAVHGMWQEHKRRFDAFVAESKPHKDAFNVAVKNLPVTTARWMELVLENEEPLAKIADAQAELDKRFFQEVRTLLTEAQQGGWARFENRLARKRWTQMFASFFEERVDLVGLVERLEREESIAPERDAALVNVLDQYEAALGTALRARAKHKIDRARELYRRDKDRYRIDLENDKSWMDEGTGDWETRYRQSWEEQGAVHRAVRDVNRSFMPMVQAALPEAARAMFERMYYEQALHENTRTAPLVADSFIDATKELNDASDDQRSYFDAQEALYEAEFLVRARNVIRRNDEYRETFFQRPNGPLSAHDLDSREQKLAALKASLSEMYDSERRIVENVWATLTEQQRQRVQKPSITPPVVK
jgi:hypothetical protein